MLVTIIFSFSQNIFARFFFFLMGDKKRDCVVKRLIKQMNNFFNTIENIVGKRRKCWLPAFFPFLKIFSQVFCFPPQARKKYLLCCKTVEEENEHFFHRIENIVGKGENAGYQHFLLFPKCSRKLLFLLL